MTKSYQGEKQFEGLLSLYLRERQTEKGSGKTQSHLDEDSLSAFVEGALTQPQAALILKHLVDCISCRRVTAQLAELDSALDSAPMNVDVVKVSNKWDDYWSYLTESVFRPDDIAIVAHESKKDTDQDQESEPDKK